VPEIALRDEILPLEDPRVRRNEAYLLNRPLCESFGRRFVGMRII
jgi:hypothetical protein